MRLPHQLASKCEKKHKLAGAAASAWLAADVKPMATRCSSAGESDKRM
jgi:hypothetical protein